MHGGLKVYRGAAAAARQYVEADRGRADDYYLTEGTGIARRYTATPDGPVEELAGMDGDAYQAWVAGRDPDTGQPRGRLRADEHAVRFVEVVVNGPKSWSLAAELHPDVAVAYEAAQDRATEQILGWLAHHATARVGPRGGQVAVPVDQLEAAVIRHYTSRAGDPHRHLHLQLNARVYAAGKWRGIDTIAVRDSIAAVNGIGHAAVATDPQFRAALAAHGYVLEPSGEIAQLAGFVGAFSKRAAQIERHLHRYEADWKAAHPGQQPGPALYRAWNARAWVEQRPDKGRPEPGEQLRGRWLTELARLGYRDRNKSVSLIAASVGELNRDQAVADVLARLAAARSAWNAADVRGEVEQLLVRHGVVTDPAVRGELADDLTARTLTACLPLLTRPGVPAHIRALTSRRVLDVEADLVCRLAVRGAETGHDLEPFVVAQVTDRAGVRLDRGQAAAVAEIKGLESKYDSIYLVGHSLGGIVAAKIAREYFLRRPANVRTNVAQVASVITVASPRLGTVWSAPILRLLNQDLRALRRNSALVVSSAEFFTGDSVNTSISRDTDPAEYFIPTFGCAGLRDVFVGRVSALLGIPEGQRKYWSMGHLRIAKPSSNTDEQVTWLLDVIGSVEASRQGNWSAPACSELRRGDLISSCYW